MAWGKAIPAWHGATLQSAANSANAAGAGADAAASSPRPVSLALRLQAALDLLIQLNDKFALDGGAPPSYGGLLWCLGWRDRPGEHGCPTLRPTSVMASRIRPGDLERKARTRCGGLLGAPPAASAAAASAAAASAAAASAASALSSASASAASAAPSAAARASAAAAYEPIAFEPTPAQEEAMARRAPAGLSDQSSTRKRSPPTSAPGSKRQAPATISGTLFSHWLNRDSSAALAAQQQQPPSPPQLLPASQGAHEGPEDDARGGEMSDGEEETRRFLTE